MNEGITLSVLLIGSGCTMLSAWVCLKFYFIGRKSDGDARHLANAFSYQLFAEFVTMTGTMLFTIAAYLNVLKTWSIELQSVIRIAMFSTTAFTTVHLIKTLILLQKRD